MLSLSAEGTGGSVEGATQMVVLTVAGLSVAAMLAVYAFAVQRPRARRRWDDIATQLGLAPADGSAVDTGPKLVGWKHGVRVAVETHARGGHRHAGRIDSVVRARLTMPLDLFLSVSQVHEKRLLTGSLATGDPSMDAHYRTTGNDAARVMALLTPALRAVLNEVAPSMPKDANFMILDGGPQLELKTAKPSAEQLAWGLDLVVRAAVLLEQARAGVPGAFDLASFREAWRSRAHQLGLRVTETPLAIAGSVSGVHAAAWVALHRSVRPAPPSRHFLVVRVSFPRSLGLGLRVRTSGAPTATDAVLDEQAMNVSDPIFRKVFRATAIDAHRASALVDGEMANALMDLQRRYGQVALEDGSCSVAVNVLPDPEQSLAVLHHVAELARWIAGRAGLIAS